MSMEEQPVNRCVVCLMSRIGVGNTPGDIAATVATVITHVLKTGVSKVLHEMCVDHLRDQARVLYTTRFVDEARAIVAEEGR